jgi:hypothetical protein
LNIGPVLHHPHIRNSIDPADGVVDHQLRLDLAPVLDQHQNTDHRVVCDADVAVDVTHLPEAAFGHAADMAARLEGSVDPVLVPVLRREVRRCELNQVPVLNKETKICLLMTDKAKLVAAHVNGAPLHSNFPEKERPKTTIMVSWEEGASLIGGSSPRCYKASLMKSPGSAQAGSTKA